MRKACSEEGRKKGTFMTMGILKALPKFIYLSALSMESLKVGLNSTTHLYVKMYSLPSLREKLKYMWAIYPTLFLGHSRVYICVTAGKKIFY